MTTPLAEEVYAVLSGAPVGAGRDGDAMSYEDKTEDAMTLLKGLQHAQACLGETRCSDREGHALAEKALAAAIAAEESAPATVTAEEIEALIGVAARRQQAVFSSAICAATIAALCAARTAMAVAAARAEERERVLTYAVSMAAAFSGLWGIPDEKRRALQNAIRQAPAPAIAAGVAAPDAADLDRLIAAIEAVVERLHSGGPIVEHLEQADTDALHELWKCQNIATRAREALAAQERKR